MGLLETYGSEQNGLSGVSLEINFEPSLLPAPRYLIALAIT